MRDFSKPTILISKCIEHSNCRYDGSMISSPAVRQLIPYVNFITLCPETELGLPIPRNSLRLVGDLEEQKLMVSMSGEDYTRQMEAYSLAMLERLSSESIDACILKHKSPSCGMAGVKIYTGIGKSPVLMEKTSGVFGRRVLETFPNIPIENEGRLRNFNIREHFFIHIYTLMDYKKIVNQPMKALVSFHSANKYLFMALSPGKLKRMGKVVANHDHLTIDHVHRKYYPLLLDLLHQPMSRTRNINTLLHVYGYFKYKVNEKEKAYFLDLMDKYQKKKIPYLSVLHLLRSWVIRYEEDYLATQTLFEPYPDDLFDVTDSGKGL